MFAGLWVHFTDWVFCVCICKVDIARETRILELLRHHTTLWNQKPWHGPQITHFGSTAKGSPILLAIRNWGSGELGHSDVYKHSLTAPKSHTHIP